MKGKSLFIILLMLLGFSLTATGQITVDGSVAAVNTDYFMVNVESGLYLKFGGANNAKAAEGHAGTIIRLERLGNNYAIKTNAGYLDSDLMMNGSASEWVFTKVEGKNQYYLKTSNGHGVLSTKNDANGVLRLASYNPDDNKQKWILITKNNITKLLDVTPLVRAASFDKNDAISSWRLNADDIIGTIENSDAAEYHLMVTGKKTITQDLGTCPSGTYVLSFDAYYQRTSTSGNVIAPTVSVKVHNKSTSVPINESDTWGKYSLTLLNNGGKSMAINIGSEDNVELHVDNFVLKYITGHNQDEDKVEQEEQSQFVSRLNTYIEETQAKVDALNEAGRAVYDISGVIADRDAGNIKTEEAFLAAIAAIDAAYEVALAAHNRKELDDLLNGGNNGGDGGDDGDDNEGDDETEEEDKEVDVTDLFIKNAGFGTGDDRYWTINGAVISTSGVNVTGATGSYMFRGRSIAQDVTVANGKYKLTAKVASTNGAAVTLTANKGLLTEQSTSVQTSAAMTEISLDKVIVYNGMLLIQAAGDAEFYTDDFTLSFREALPEDPQLVDTEVLAAAVDFYPTITVARTLKADTWSTVVFPFDMDIPAGWEVKTLASSTSNGDHITLYFEDVESIEAGVPYMVRTAEATSTVIGRNVWLNTELKSTSTDHVTFVGVYEAGNIPAGAFFISANKFWYAQDNSNKIKAYRAYIQPMTSNARALNYRVDGDGTTAIDDEQLANDNDVIVVAIYTLGGTRISDMQQGVNILQMSNGTTIKVVVK